MAQAEGLLHPDCEEATLAPGQLCRDFCLSTPPRPVSRTGHLSFMTIPFISRSFYTRETHGRVYTNKPRALLMQQPSLFVCALVLVKSVNIVLAVMQEQCALGPGHGSQCPFTPSLLWKCPWLRLQLLIQLQFWNLRQFL